MHRHPEDAFMEDGGGRRSPIRCHDLRCGWAFWRTTPRGEVEEEGCVRFHIHIPFAQYRSYHERQIRGSASGPATITDPRRSSWACFCFCGFVLEDEMKRNRRRPARPRWAV